MTATAKTTEWIKMTDRRPTEQDLPVWVWFAYDKECRGPYLFDEQLCTDGATHWRPAKDDIPEPPMEITQDCKDYAAYAAWFLDLKSRPIAEAAWHAALAWERGEVKKMLPNTSKISMSFYESELANAIESIRARCGGGK